MGLFEQWGWLRRVKALPTSWRPFVAEPFWDQHDVTISSEGGGGGRRSFEVHVQGRLFATRPRLDEAKAAVEAVYGPLAWSARRLTKVETDHYHYGPTTEFTSPMTIWVASLAPLTGKPGEVASAG